MTDDICLTCKHYTEETDYCDLDQFDGEEKGLLGERIPLTECVFYEWKDEKGHIYP